MGNTTDHVTPRGRWRPGWLVAIGILAVVAPLGAYSTMFSMPGKSLQGPLPPLTDAERAIASELQAMVGRLAGEIGPRDAASRHAALREAEDYIAAIFAAAGYEPRRQTWETRAGRAVANVEAERPGSSAAAGVLVVGAHYDAVMGSPGANDNASGTAVLLALARRFALAEAPGRTIRFVGFANEEPPYFQTPDMGSWRYARRCRDRSERVGAMLSLESLGYYDDAPGSQRYPFPLGYFYPSAANFVGFVGNLANRSLVRFALGAFRAGGRMPSEGVAAPAWIDGIAWSDHWAFWDQGYPGIMVTDTALMRDPAYHTQEDLPERLDYGRMARVVSGLGVVLDGLSSRNALPGD